MSVRRHCLLLHLALHGKRKGPACPFEGPSVLIWPQSLPANCEFHKARCELHHQNAPCSAHLDPNRHLRVWQQRRAGGHGAAQGGGAHR